MKDTIVRKCKNCNKVIPTKRRIDAIFCSVECGVQFRNYNVRIERKNKDVKSIENNYKILNSFILRDVFKISLTTLDEIGFNQECFTGSSIEKDGSFTFQVYNIQMNLNNSQVTLTKK